MNDLNKILLIILNSGDRLCFTLSHTDDLVGQYKNILISEGISEEDVKKNYFFPETPFSADNFVDFFDEETETIDDKSLVIERKLEVFRKQRLSFFTVLDLEFMKSIEEDCAECKEHVVEIKNYLRNLPSELSKAFIDLNTEQILTFNAFNNVLGINIINGGAGYTSPPKITISEPEQSGFHMKAQALIADGSVTSVIVTQVGSGYIKRPKITVEAPPDSLQSETAILIAKNIENDSYKE
tara:strand:- start:959 stop:1678 length:720 start_codon:yes stop_codon:yes gene_type:complete